MKHLFRNILFILLLSSLTSCHIGRFFYYNFADAKDFKKFPYQEIKRDSTAISGPVFKVSKSNNKTLYYSNRENSKIPLSEFLDAHKTLAFIVIKKDSIIYEAYFDGYDSSSIIPVFSVAKSYISALVGIALNKGYFKSIEDSVTTYIPELQGKGLEEISLRNLLEMQSGLDYKEKYTSPFADMAKYYYGKNLDKYIQKLKLSETPGNSYNYQSVNTLLLSMALENTTGKSAAELLEEWIWQKTDMEFDASWSVDSRKNNRIKSFCCLNLRARDLAKFGQLYQNKGAWNNEQIIPQSWIEESLRIENNSRDSGGYPYTYHWRSLEDGSFFAKGVLGQYLFVDPKKDLIFVRLGKSADKVNWPEVFRDLAKKL
ncbi:MAG: beta-lactamase family protein [Bacteroidales bacterium]|nr:beta-lactamase family protein [Bacteroidales bacterium]